MTTGNYCATPATNPLTLGERLLSAGMRALPVKHGKHRLLDRICARSWVKREGNVAIKVGGKEVIVATDDLVGWHFAVLRNFDPEVSEVLVRAADPDTSEVFWDIGANKGSCFSDLATRLPKLKVVAIEPFSRHAENNLRNLESLCAGRYEYVQRGIGVEETQTTLVIPHSNMGKASLHLQAKPGDLQETITITTASAIAENSAFGWPTLAKIDVEGHEPQVFASLAPCFEQRICKVVVFENHARESDSFRTIKGLIEPFGYQTFAIQKSIWSTQLLPAQEQVPGSTDYAIIRSDLVESNKPLRAMFRR